jgi:hypothetical protein
MVGAGSQEHIHGANEEKALSAEQRANDCSSINRQIYAEMLSGFIELSDLRQKEKTPLTRNEYYGYVGTYIFLAIAVVEAVMFGDHLLTGSKISTDLSVGTDLSSLLIFSFSARGAAQQVAGGKEAGHEDADGQSFFGNVTYLVNLSTLGLYLIATAAYLRENFTSVTPYLGSASGSLLKTAGFICGVIYAVRSITATLQDN